jgi:uncharacterized iron-regulated protein
MIYLSFAWTTKAFLSGNKTATRRDWTWDYAQQFIDYAVNQKQPITAVNRSLRFGGKRIGMINEVTQVFQQPLNLMTMQDIKEEGNLWASVDEFIECMDCSPEKVLWVVKFINPFKKN